MKKLIVLSIIAAIITTFSCSKKTIPAQGSMSNTDNSPVVTPAKPTVSYNANVKSLIQAKCTPCHIPASGGFKKALDTYADVKQNIDDIIIRIKLDPSQRGFMPFKHAPLTADEIAIFTNWKDGGFTEN